MNNPLILNPYSQANHKGVKERIVSWQSIDGMPAEALHKNTFPIFIQGIKMNA